MEIDSRLNCAGPCTLDYKSKKFVDKPRFEVKPLYNWEKLTLVVYRLHDHNELCFRGELPIGLCTKGKSVPVHSSTLSERSAIESVVGRNLVNKLTNRPAFSVEDRIGVIRAPLNPTEALIAVDVFLPDAKINPLWKDCAPSNNNNKSSVLLPCTLRDIYLFIETTESEWLYEVCP